MSVLSGIARRVFGRVAASPAIQEETAQLIRASPYLKAARDLAYSTMPDDHALRELQSRVERDEVGLEVAIGQTAGRRSDYISDRAFRLLSPVAERTQVRPIDRAFADLFAHEEELGRLPLREAFKVLADLEPGLRDLATRGMVSGVDASTPRPFDQQAVRRPGRAEESRLVGIGAGSETPLLGSDIAASIVRQYLDIDAGRMPGDLNKPYFDAPRRVIYRRG
jgi:hypothetical protein